MDAPSNEDLAPARPRRGLGLLLLFLLPLALRLAPLEHGHGTNYIPDTHVVRSALGMAQDKHPVPEVGVYSTYPNLLPYTLLPIYGAEYALGRGLGWWGGTGEFAMRAKQDPAIVHLPARVWLAFLCSLTPLFVFWTARRGGLELGAWVAAWLVSTGLLHLHFSVQERPWGPLVLFLAAAAFFAARHAQDGRRRDLLLCATAAGLGFATHQAGALGLGIAGLAWLLGPWSEGMRSKVVLGVKAVALFGVVSLFLGHPYYLVHGIPETAAVAAGDAIAESEDRFIAVGGQALRLKFSLQTFERLSWALLGYDPVLLVLALLGLIPALLRRALLPGLLFGVGWAAFFMTNTNDHVRYLLPLVVLFAPAAGWAAEFAVRRGLPKPALWLLLAVPLVQAVRLDWVLMQRDTRTLAEAALVIQPPAGAVGIDIGGPEVPLSEAALARLQDLRPLGGREQHRLDSYSVGAGELLPPGIDALPLNALIDLEVRRWSSAWKPIEGLTVDADGNDLDPDPTALLRELGVEHLLLADRTPGDERGPLLIDPRAADEGWPKLEFADWEPVPGFVFDPRPSSATETEALLPVEMNFALLDLWRVERPGPWLGLYENSDAR
jgi:hypothetical protein